MSNNGLSRLALIRRPGILDPDVCQHTLFRTH